MGVATIIKRSLGKQFLRNLPKWRIRKKMFFNFETARSIAIIFDATSSEEYTSSRFLCNYFIEKKVKCRCLGFLKPQDTKEGVSGSMGFSFFTEKDFTLSGKPDSPTTLEFCNAEFDILIDIHVNENYFIDAIVGFSIAHMKIGLQKNDRGFYDFMLQLQEPVSTDVMINQLKLYLNQIKTS